MKTTVMKKSLTRHLVILVTLLLPAGPVRAAEHAEASKAPSHAPAHAAAPAHGASAHEPAPAAVTHAKPAEARHEPSATEKEAAPAPSHGASSVQVGPTDEAVSSVQALALLKDGNARYVADKPQPTNISAQRRTQTAAGQHPFVTIVSCSDSRVPPESIFDRGLGELFIVRVAGNICADDELGSVEYAVEHLHTPLVLVMGHTKCGAVTAAAEGGELPGHIRSLVSNITPAVEAARKAHPEMTGTAIVPEAIVANVYRGIEHMLTESDIVRQHVQSGQVRVEAVIYDIATGKVEWLGAHPHQADLLRASEAGIKSKKPEGTAAALHEAPAGEAGGPGENSHAPSAPTAAMSKALAESAHSEPMISHTVASTHANSVTSRPSEAATEPMIQPAPHALPGLLERCMAEELYRLGVQHLEKREYAEAASRFQAASGIDPSMLAARNDLAGVYCMQQKYEEALKLYTAILEADGQYRHAMRGAALCHASLKRYDQARTMLNRLLDTDRRDARTWLELGDVCFLDNDATAARQFWTKASQVNESDADVIKQARVRLKVYPAQAPAPNAQASR